MSLGQNLYRLRTEKHLSQEALAELMQVSRQSVSKWETDASVPELDKLVRLGEIFGVSLDRLVNGTGPEAASPAGAAVTPPRLPSGQKLTGLVLLAVWGGITLLSLLLGGLMGALWSGFLLGSPLLVCGVICLVLKRRVGLWCGWGVFFCLEYFLRYATGITWQDVRFTLRLGLEIRLLIAWADLLFLLVLMLCTLRSFRDLRLTLNRPKTLLFGLGWAVWLILHTPLVWGRLPAFTSDLLWMLQDDLPAVLLTVLLVVLLSILPRRAKN